MVTSEREAGFAIANIQTSFERDPRVRRMREALAFRDYLAATSLYLLLVLASWREARRVALHEEFSEPAEQDVAALRKYGLIDHQFRIRRAAFDHHIGRAIRNRAEVREQARERQRRRRNQGPPETRAGGFDAASSRTNLIPSDSPQVIPVHLSREVTRDSSKQERDTGKTYVFSETGENPEDARATADVWVVLATAVEELTGQPYALPSPHSKLGQLALELVRHKGLDVTLSALHRAALMVEDGHPDAGQVVLGASNLLRPIPGSRAAVQSGDRGHTRPVKEVASAFNRD